MPYKRKRKAVNPGSSKQQNSNIFAQHQSPSGKALHTIPTGRQLPRTPVKGISSAEDCKNETRDILVTEGGINNENVPYPECFSAAIGENVAKDEFGERREMDEEFQRTFIRRSSVTIEEKQPEEIHVDNFIGGMVGYQWTEEDLQFVESTKNKRLIQKLQKDLRVLLKQLEGAHQERELKLASRDMFLARHPEFPAAYSTMLQARDFLSRRLEAAKVEALDHETLLARIQEADVQQALHEERAEMAELEERWAGAQKLRKLQEKWSREAMQQEKKIIQKQAKVDSLSQELSQLELKLVQTENALQAAQKQIKLLKVPESAVDESEVVLRRSKRIANRKF